LFKLGLLMVMSIMRPLGLFGSAALDLGQDFVNHRILGHGLSQGYIQPL
jgi:hypothetical protein